MHEGQPKFSPERTDNDLSDARRIGYEAVRKAQQVMKEIKKGIKVDGLAGGLEKFREYHKVEKERSVDTLMREYIQLIETQEESLRLLRDLTELSGRLEEVGRDGKREKMQMDVFNARRSLRKAMHQTELALLALDKEIDEVE